MGAERRSSIGISSSRGRRILSNKQNILEILAILVVTICVTFAGAEQQQQQQQQRETLQQSISPKQNGFTKQQQHDLFLQSSDSDSISDVLDRTNGAQFVALFDPLMEGRITGIMDRFRTKYPDSVWRRLLELPSRNFLQALDGLSGGRLTMLFNAYSPSRARRAPLDTMSGMSLGNAKRSSLDPMNGLSFGAPASKRNFDEIDRMGFSGFAKRFADFDEIDRAGFSGFSKRKSSSDFDEIDRAGFSGFAKKRFADFDEIDRAGFSGFAKKRFNFDELDRVGFNGFTKRQAQNPLISMMRANSIKLSPSKAQQSSEISNKQ